MTKKISDGISLIAIGLGIGWLVGLSVTPGTTSIILTSIMTIVVLLITVVSGLEKETSTEEQKSYSKWKVSPIPLALFIVGLVVGSSVGIYARTHNWLGVDPQPTTTTKEGANVNYKSGVSFSVEHDECKRLLTYEDDELPNQLEYSTIEIFNELPGIFNDPKLLREKLLREVVKKQCATFQKGE